MKSKIKENGFLIIVALVSLAIIGFLLLRVYHLENPNAFDFSSQNVNLWAIFLTGLLAGGLSCLAVQGGLLAATIAQREEEKLKDKTKKIGNAVPILSFLVSKLIAYTIFGFFLGWFGSLFQLSIIAQTVMQLIVVIFMLGTALNILNIHPVFRYFVVMPPKSFTKIVRSQSKSKSIFAPALLGAFTVFIPCGVTQTMMALAIGSANPLLGASILFAFVLGTSPLFYILGYFATRLKDSLQEKFMKVAAVFLILLAIFNMNNVLALMGFSWWIVDSSQDKTQEKPSQKVVINIMQTGYDPSAVTVKSGENVTFEIKNDGVYTCASAFTIPYFNYQKIIQSGDTEIISFKMPDNPTQIPFMCSMGMYRGVINVI